VIDHKEIVQAVSHKLGKIGIVGKHATYNPKTKKWFAFADNYVPDPVIWRHDYWNGVGLSPNTWENVRKAAPQLKAHGHPIGIGQSAELDSSMALLAFLMCFGTYVQSENARVTIKSKHTVEAVKFMADIFKRGETNEIFGWTPSSNNDFIYSGKGSLILNAISATRTPEDLHLPFADQLYINPIPRGPVRRLGLEHVMGCYSIWKFAKNKAAAKKFLADLEINYRQAFMASKFYNFPTWPKAMPFSRIRKVAGRDPHKPHGKYQVLTTIAQKYTVNPGYPGYTNAAFSEMFNKFLVPKMFAQVSQGKMSADDAVSAANHDIAAIYTKWRKLGKI
jgi:multiple sugar transport system substrate-binding protein